MMRNKTAYKIEKRTFRLSLMNDKKKGRQRKALIHEVMMPLDLCSELPNIHRVMNWEESQQINFAVTVHKTRRKQELLVFNQREKNEPINVFFNI